MTFTHKFNLPVYYINYTLRHQIVITYIIIDKQTKLYS